MRLAAFGSYFAGGRTVTVSGQQRRSLHVTASTSIVHDPNGDYPIESAYVQWFEPATIRHELPIVLVHGGGLSGASWETTPDGRPGWLHAFLNTGWTVHVVDSVERGRAGWCSLPEVWPEGPVMRSLQEAWTLFRFGPAEGFASRQPFARQRFPVEALETLGRQFVPRWTTNGMASRTALEAIVQKIGNCILVCHSQGGESAFHVAADQPDLVKAVIAIEPSGGYACAPRLARTPVMIMMGDHLESCSAWAEPTRQINQFTQDLISAGGTVNFDDLPKQGISGNSHMLMMDDNNQQLAQRVSDWLEAVLTTTKT